MKNSARVDMNERISLHEIQAFDPKHHSIMVIYNFEGSYRINYYSNRGRGPFRDDLPLVGVDRNGNIIQDNNNNSFRLFVLLYTSEQYKKFRAAR